MAKNIRKKKRSIRGFFTGEKGQRTFNYAYSIGASIVILGSLFKLLHLPGADFMLILGMGTEATIFFLSAFDEPAKDYKWENVFPTLDDPEATPNNAPNFSQGMGGNGGGTVIIGNVGSTPSNDEDTVAAVAAASANNNGAVVMPSMPASALSPEAAAQLNTATEQYVQQIKEMTEQLAQLQNITASLNSAQSSLLNSYKTLNGDDSATTNYMSQMEALSRNVSGLNAIYEIQLKSVSSQLDTIDKVNAGLNNIRAMYENGSNDSFRIRQETEHMTQTLAQLNGIYERMLQAMTVNMGFAARPTTGYQTQAQPQPQTFAQTQGGYQQGQANGYQPGQAGYQAPAQGYQQPYQAQPGQGYQQPNGGYQSNQ